MHNYIKSYSVFIKWSKYIMPILAIILFSSIFIFGKEDALRSGNISINNDIFDLTIKVCNRANTIVDSSAIQILITLIQTYKYYKDAGINNGNNLKNDGYRMYRERYFDLINLYETYDSFHTYREYMKTKLNKLNIEVSGLFDVVKDNDTVTDEIRSLLTFD